MTEQEIKKMMEDLEALRVKDQKAKDRTKKYGEKQRAKTKLLVEKAIAAGIVVTEEEIQAEMAKA
jgi:hypothetical protein